MTAEGHMTQVSALGNVVFCVVILCQFASGPEMGLLLSSASMFLISGDCKKFSGTAERLLGLIPNIGRHTLISS